MYKGNYIVQRTFLYYENHTRSQQDGNSLSAYTHLIHDFLAEGILRIMYNNFEQNTSICENFSRRAFSLIVAHIPVFYFLSRALHKQKSVHHFSVQLRAHVLETYIRGLHEGTL